MGGAKMKISDKDMEKLNQASIIVSNLRYKYRKNVGWRGVEDLCAAELLLVDAIVWLGISRKEQKKPWYARK